MTTGPRLLALALVLAACTERPQPGETDASSGTLDPGVTVGASDSTSEDSPTGGTTNAVPGVHAGPCRPVDGPDICPMGHMCCSDDPATAHGLLPNYYQDGVDDDHVGTPLFSSISNVLSYWGYCIDTGRFTSPLLNGCPVPCNPTWSSEQLAEICGTSQCCSFTKVDPAKDCIMVDGRWRTVRGVDVIAERTPWGPTHATNQDPFAESCNLIANGDQGVLRDCILQLGVADQRGFCFAFDCPCVEDVCAMKNPDYVPRCN